jgi:tetratricopeptide (TPR) repeat protein
MGRLDEAVVQFQAALQLTPNDAETHYLLGAAYIGEEELQELHDVRESVLRRGIDRGLSLPGLHVHVGAVSNEQTTQLAVSVE